MPSENKFDDCGSHEVQQFVPPPMRELIEVEFSPRAPSGVGTWDFDADDEYQGKAIRCLVRSFY